MSLYVLRIHLDRDLQWLVVDLMGNVGILTGLGTQNVSIPSRRQDLRD